METKIVLYGASGHAKVIIDLLQNNDIDNFILLDDDSNKVRLLNYDIIHREKYNFDDTEKVIISIGDNKLRKNIAENLNIEFIGLKHPKAVTPKNFQLNAGTVIMSGVVINPDVKIGKHCIINSGSIVEHDCLIEDFVHISPNATLCGNVKIGEGTQIGAGSVIIPNIKIGKWATVGAGAVIIKDVPDYAVVVGNPGKIIKYN